MNYNMADTQIKKDADSDQTFSLCKYCIGIKYSVKLSECR